MNRHFPSIALSYLAACWLCACGSSSPVNLPAGGSSSGSSGGSGSSGASACAADSGSPAPVSSGDPLRLSTDTSGVAIDSCYGSGVFGQWVPDDYNLPGYRYDIDEETDPRAQQPELLGNNMAQLQLGNTRAKAYAYNHGYTQFWSQDRNYQWANLYQADQQHYAGGYGYLLDGGSVTSTLYDDKPAGAQMTRYFGTGYYAKDTRTSGAEIQEKVYAPWGDDPVLLHEVSITNTGAAARDLSWFEYWDVNPRSPNVLSLNLTPPSPDTVIGIVQGYGKPSVQVLIGTLGFDSAAYDAASRTLSVQQIPYLADTNPLSIYASALDGPVSGYETSIPQFFGSGGRAMPDEVKADALSGTLAGPALPIAGQGGQTLFAFRAPLHLAAGQSVTLRYAYGMAHAAAIPALVAKYQTDTTAFNDTRAAWRKALPKADFGPGRQWMNRELMWTAYTLLSGVTYEEALGHHILSQSGYYQYAEGMNAGFRSWMHYVLPMKFLSPDITREMFRYSIASQPGLELDYQFPYSFIGNGVRFDLGLPDDFDFWLLNAAPDWYFATRDLSLFKENLPFYLGLGSDTAWNHIKLAFQHQETFRALGPHGLYLTLPFGDWSDLSSVYLQMTESNMVAAQTAYAYPRLAELADAMGDAAFAQQVRATAAQVMQTLQGQWIDSQGWFSRGYAITNQLGTGAMFMEPQPWALLAGATTPQQSRRLVANYQRFLLGQNAPAAIHGPTPLGASQSPAANDPAVTEISAPAAGVGDNNAIFVGGAWYDLNGDMTWALGELDGIVPNARSLAFDEYRRNALATHASVFPAHWNNVITADDVCDSFYSSHPDNCGINSTINFDGWNMEQPTWFTMNALNLAGIRPTTSGYHIAPHYPFDSFSFRFPQIGIASAPNLLRGYIVPQAAGPMQLQVQLPAGVTAASIYQNGQPLAGTVSGGLASFTLAGQARQPVDWAVRW